MDNLFKYIILLILISFLIVRLRNNSIYEGYTGENDKNYLLQESILKYNSILDPQNAGSLNVCHGSEIVNTIKEKYTPLKQRTFGDYMPYENILSKDFKFERIKPEIKTEKITIEPEIKTTPPKDEDVKTYADKFANKLFIPENACKGEWSEWNTKECGSFKNKCGIQSKRYKIIQREISNEKGEGLPCEYKDGDVKYKYCIGTGLDVEADQERCNLNHNVCHCKLNNDTVKLLNGENVYDLLDESCETEKNINCSCPRGSSLILEDEDASKIGRCKLKECTCENGTEIPSDQCNIHEENSCKLMKCNEGYILEGSPLECNQHTDEKCNCPYGEPVNDPLCNNPRALTLKCRQDGCSPGYRWTDDTSECDLYFTNIGNDQSQSFNSQNCCVPNNEQCNFSNLAEKNIIHKGTEGTNNLSTYMNKTIQELIEEYELLEINNKLSTDTLLDHQSPKLYIIQQIIKNKENLNGDECITTGNIERCKYTFQCAPGYSFQPDDENDDELKITDCNDDGVIFNGSCLPVSCNIPPEIKKLYNISFDKCYSNTINCGIRSLSCSKEEYNVSNQNKKIFCPAPYKIKSTDVDIDYGLVSMGCAEEQKKKESILEPPMEGTSDTLDKP